MEGFHTGFDSTYRSDVDVFGDIAGWLAIAYEKKTRLSSIIYLHGIKDRRIIPALNFDIFRELCGSNCFSEVTLASTMWDEVDDVDLARTVRREHELTSDERFWGSMVKQESRVARHSHSRDSAMSIVDSIFERQRIIVLEVQDEMVNKRLRLDETAAGQLMSRELLHQRDIVQQRIRNQQNRMQHMRERIEEKGEDPIRLNTKSYEYFQERNARQKEGLDQQIRDLRVSFENLKWEREQEFESIQDIMSEKAAVYRTKNQY
jgi:hypothetical protein